MTKIQATTEYRHVMALFSDAGITDRQDRLMVASRILGTTVESFTDLCAQDASRLCEALSVWRYLQQVRVANGSILKESFAFVDMVNDDSMLTVEDDSILATTFSRRMVMARKNVAAKVEDFDDVMRSISSELHMEQAELVAHDGRWDKSELITAPTASLGLMLGAGGIPRGYIYHFWGKNHAGKTLLSYHLIAEAQRQDIPCVLINAESALQADFAAGVGVDVSAEKLKVFQVGSVERAGELLKRLSRTDALIVIDSMPALLSEREIERDLTNSDAKVGGVAASWASILSMCRQNMAFSKATIVAINQVRSNMDRKTKYDPEIKPWGSEILMHSFDFSAKVDQMSKSARPSFVSADHYRGSFLTVQKNRFGVMPGDRIGLVFRPGQPYNREVDLLEVLERSSGAHVRGEDGQLEELGYADAAGYPIVKDYKTVDINSKAESLTQVAVGSQSLRQAKGFYAIRLDPYAAAALAYDIDYNVSLDPERFADREPILEELGVEPDGDFYKLLVDNNGDLSKIDYEIPTKVYDQDSGEWVDGEMTVSVPPIEELSDPDFDDATQGTWMTLKYRDGRASKKNTAVFLSQHPTLTDVIIERLYYGLGRVRKANGELGHNEVITG